MECDYDWNQNTLQKAVDKKKHKKSRKDISYTLKFPSDKIKQAKFETSEQVSTFLLKDALEIGLIEWQIFLKSVFDKGNSKEIAYTCRIKYCDAMLIFIQKKILNQKGGQQKKYYLIEKKIQNEHRHVLRLTPMLTSEQNIRQYLYDLPVQQKYENHVVAIKQKFGLTTCQARHLKERVFWKFKSEDHMLKKLIERKVMFRRKIEQEKTVILLLVSETMKKSYLQYGDVICFDITYKLLRKTFGQSKHVGVGFFVGQDENTRISLFGMCTIIHETSQNFQTMFEFFFQIMEHPPQTILTDDQQAVGIAIERLKKQKNYDYVHLLDWFHKTQAMKRSFKKQPCGYELLDLIYRVFKEPSKRVYKDILIQIADMLQNPQIMLAFIKQQHRYCLTYAPQRFFAFGIATSRAESFNNLIKKSVPVQTNLSRLVFFVLRVQKRLLHRTEVLNYMNPQIIKPIKDEQVLMLSQNLQHLPFEQIRQYYQQSQMLELVDSTNPIRKTVKYQKYEREYRFNLMYDLRCNCWRCQCKNNFRTGMPCCHLFAVIKKMKGCYSYYINQRWFHDKENANIKKPSRPRNISKKI